MRPGPCPLCSTALSRVSPKEPDAGRLQRHALRLEGEIRALAAERSKLFSSSAGPEMRVSLTELWDAAAGRLGVSGDELFRDSLNRLRAAIKTDGEVVDCDGRCHSVSAITPGKRFTAARPAGSRRQSAGW